MSDHDFVLESETAENLVASPPPVVSNTVTGLPPRRKNKSNVWDYFTLEPGLEKKARCNYCGSVLKCNNGTSSMIAHANKCKSNPNSEASKRLKSTSSSTTNVTSPSLPKFDQEKCRQAVVKMVVAMELPYRHVEHTAFRECMSVLQPKFDPISRSTVARDALLLWDTEKTKLKYFLSHHCRSACLTTDSWTSCQNMSYMCITAHFVDNNWTLHKKILGFPQVTSYSGDSIASEVAQCLDEWGLNRVMTVTVDNASANDRGIEILKTMLKLKTMSSASKSELSKYLSEDLESSSTGFDILNWWKVNSSRLPILASIAREVLAIPVSTVASESAFSTGGRVIDEYRSRLTPKTVEALICTEDWLNGSPLPLPSQEDIEEIENFEQEIFSLNLEGGASATHITLHED